MNDPLQKIIYECIHRDEVFNHGFFKPISNVFAHFLLKILYFR